LHKLAINLWRFDLFTHDLLMFYETFSVLTSPRLTDLGATPETLAESLAVSLRIPLLFCSIKQASREPNRGLFDLEIEVSGKLEVARIRARS
jgi:hypothetical protein